MAHTYQLKPPLPNYQSERDVIGLRQMLKVKVTHAYSVKHEIRKSKIACNLIQDDKITKENIAVIRNRLVKIKHHNGSGLFQGEAFWTL